MEVYIQVSTENSSTGGGLHTGQYRELFYWWRFTYRSVQRTLLLVEVYIQVSTENSSTGGGLHTGQYYSQRTLLLVEVNIQVSTENSSTGGD